MPRTAGESAAQCVGPSPRVCVLHLALWRQALQSKRSIDPSFVALAHDRFLRGDESASSELVNHLLEPVSLRLADRWPGIDRAIINDAVEDALMSYLRHASYYNPAKARLDTFIAFVATRDLLNAIRKGARRRRADESLATNLAHMSTLHVEGHGPAPSAFDPVAALRQLTTNWSPKEQMFMCARLEGEHRTSKLAAILGLEEASATKQRIAVKQMTDRLRLRLRRLVHAS